MTGHANSLTGGEVINDIERLQEAQGILKILGTESIPDPTTAGDFLVRFHAKHIKAFQDSFDQIQDTAFSLLDRKRKEVATIEHDSSIHEVYGQKKQGADYAYENTYSYNVQCHPRRDRRCSSPGTSGGQPLQQLRFLTDTTGNT